MSETVSILSLRSVLSYIVKLIKSLPISKITLIEARQIQSKLDDDYSRDIDREEGMSVVDIHKRFHQLSIRISFSFECLVVFTNRRLHRPR